MFQKIMSFFMAIWSAFASLFGIANTTGTKSFEIDASVQGNEVSNFASNVNMWDLSNQFVNPVRNSEYDIFEFVDYVQIMQCTGGNEARDLFKNPLDFSVLDDYDFDYLIENCRGIITLGAKPDLILGSVPLKFTSGYKIGGFETNVYPPDDYDLYYTYIAAVAQALVDEFGKEEVLTWHFGVMTEYENADWFMAKSGRAKDSAVEFCRLYDYTVKALEDVIGKDVYVGAHSMTVTEGLWDEELFIRHCANETNYATGEKGSHLDYLSASFYDSSIGNYTKGKNLEETIGYLQKTAEKYGLTGLDYGIDEGRILSGSKGREKEDLPSRSTGYTWQAAYDARMYYQLWNSGGSYFSYWSYLSDGLLNGIPTISYHVSRLIAKYAGSKEVKVSGNDKKSLTLPEVNVKAAYSENDGVLRAFAYNFKNSLNNKTDVPIELNINAPQFEDGEVQVVLYRIDNNCNWFDEWQNDRQIYGITDECFVWSPDDANLGLMDDQNAINVFKSLKAGYEDDAKLNPETFTAKVEDGQIKLETLLKANTVVFYEISK